MNFLDEGSNMVKCMDELDSKTIMLNEIHMSMDESYKMDEIFG
jgi:hypothetical protein